MWAIAFLADRSLAKASEALESVFSMSPLLTPTTRDGQIKRSSPVIFRGKETTMDDHY